MEIRFFRSLKYRAVNPLPVIPFSQAPSSVAEFQVPGHIQHEILCPTRRRDNAVGQGLLQFRIVSARFLRAREVLLQSGGAPHRHGAADPDQLPRPGIENLFILEIENFLADFHGRLSFSVNVMSAPGNYAVPPGDLQALFRAWSDCYEVTVSWWAAMAGVFRIPQKLIADK